MRPGPVRGFAENGVISDISDLVEKHEDKIFDICLERCRIEEDILKRTGEGYYAAVPQDIGGYIIVYNRDIFEQAGLPTDWETVQEEIQTWKQFIEAGKTIEKETGAVMFADEFSGRNMLTGCLMNQLHGNYYTPKTDDNVAEFDFTQPANEKALQVAKAVKEGTGAKDYDRLGSQHVDGLRNEELACIIAPSWMQFVIKGSGLGAESAGTLGEMAGKWRGMKIPLPDDLINMNDHLPSGLEVKRAANHAGSLAGIPTGQGSDVTQASREWLEFWQLSMDKFEVMLELGGGNTFLPDGGMEILNEGVDYFGGQPINRLWTESAMNAPHQYRDPTASCRQLRWQAGTKVLTQGNSIEKTLQAQHDGMMKSIRTTFNI
jgi:ABC-type glycerol-3-phosphate transport system substrate-binding protein